MGHALVIGDVILDQWVTGRASRVSPEAPVPVVDIDGTTDSAGGAGNVVLNLAAMGHSVQLLSVIGDDGSGTRLHQLLSRSGVMPSLSLARGHQTLVKTRVVSAGQQLLRLDGGSQRLLPDASIIDTVRQLLAGGGINAVVLSDYAKGMLSGELIRVAREVAIAAGVPIIAAPKPVSMAAYAGVSVLVPNHVEAVSYASGVCVDPALDSDVLADRVEAAADFIFWELQPNMLVVTAGELGALVRTRDEKQWYPVTPQHVHDPTGAGDTFLAALVSGAMEGNPVSNAVIRANLAAGLVVREHGTVVVTRDAWDDEWYRAQGVAAKLMNSVDATLFARRAHRLNKRVVFTNGCFDMLHLGHICTLEFAREQGDVLIVACNDDAGVRRLKGAGRPLLPLPQRMVSLAKYADAVVAFSDETPLDLIRAIRPQVLVKGDDYAGTVIPGDDVVVALGGEVKLAPYLAGISTTALEQQT